MNSRIVLVTRRYWPLIGGAERVMAALGEGLVGMGAKVTILTAQWQPEWPRELVHRDAPLIRIPQPTLRGWGTMRYMLGLGRWLHHHRREIDGVVVSMLKHDAYATLSALAGKVPVVLRAEGGGSTGDCHWQTTNRFGPRIRRRCFQATAVIAPSEAIAEELRAAGYPAELIRLVPNGVEAPRTPATSTQRGNARAALGDANPDLRCPDDAAVVVYTGRLDRNKGLFDLIDAWPLVLQGRVDARLWLIGEGPDREALYQKLSDLDLRSRIFLPGSFDHIDDVLAAADAFVLPSYEEGMSLSLLEAMGAGLPVVASDIPGNRRLVDAGQHGLLTAPHDSQGLAAAILALLNDRAFAARLAAAARQRVIHEYDVATMARRHLQCLGGTTDH